MPLVVGFSLLSFSDTLPLNSSVKTKNNKLRMCINIHQKRTIQEETTTFFLSSSLAISPRSFIPTASSSSFSLSFPFFSPYLNRRIRKPEIWCENRPRSRLIPLVSLYNHHTLCLILPSNPHHCKNPRRRSRRRHISCHSRICKQVVQ